MIVSVEREEGKQAARMLLKSGVNVAVRPFVDEPTGGRGMLPLRLAEEEIDEVPERGVRVGGDGGDGGGSE